jgi:hypothetical protein
MLIPRAPVAPDLWRGSLRGTAPGVVAGLTAADVGLAEARERLRLGPAGFRPELADSAPEVEVETLDQVAEAAGPGSRREGP